MVEHRESPLPTTSHLPEQQDLCCSFLHLPVSLLVLPRCHLCPGVRANPDCILQEKNAAFMLSQCPSLHVLP